MLERYKSGNWTIEYMFCPCQTVDEQMQCSKFSSTRDFVCEHLDGDACNLPWKEE